MLKYLHHDRDLAATLVPKLLAGCNKFEELYESLSYNKEKAASAAQPKKARKKNLPYNPAELKEKLRSMTLVLEEEFKANNVTVNNSMSEISRDDNMTPT